MSDDELEEEKAGEEGEGKERYPGIENMKSQGTIN